MPPTPLDNHCKVLVVDDTARNIEVISAVLRSQAYEVVVAEDGLEALRLAVTESPDLILLDVMMPELDGYDTCRRLKADPVTRDVPVIFLTGLSDEDSIVTAFEVGGVDYLTKPFQAAELLKRVDTHLTLHRLQLHLEDTVQRRTSELQEALDEVVAAREAADIAHLDTIERLVLAAEFKDEDTANHVKRMSRYSALLAREWGLPDDEVELVGAASPMHDVGKIGVPDAILMKPGKLTDEEWETMRQHTSMGSRILNGSPSKLLQIGELIALSHHERWDGKGYPNGAYGENIPLYGRICAVADVFDALTSRRPYKEPFPNEKAFAILQEDSGTHFDPKLVDMFLGEVAEILAIQEQYQDD